MKNSNRWLSGILIIGLGGMLLTDMLLKKVYGKIDLDNPDRNFQTIPIQPFKVLQISGGNSYGIQIVQAPGFAIKLRESRKSFFDSGRVGDTLKIRFNVASHPYNDKEEPTTGLIIYCPTVSFIHCSGTNNLIKQFNIDSLCISQDANTWTSLTESNIRSLRLEGCQASWYDVKNIQVKGLFALVLKEEAGIGLKNISCEKFEPDIAENAILLSYGRPFYSYAQPKD